jgi:hypothetical protein
MAETYETLIAFCNEAGRICPRPQHWNSLYKMLQDKRRVGMGWEPPLPLILGAWDDTPPTLKAMRLAEHIEWAANHGGLEPVAKFLRSLPEENWLHIGD